MASFGKLTYLFVSNGLLRISRDPKSSHSSADGAEARSLPGDAPQLDNKRIPAARFCRVGSLCHDEDFLRSHFFQNSHLPRRARAAKFSASNHRHANQQEDRSRRHLPLRCPQHTPRTLPAPSRARALADSASKAALLPVDGFEPRPSPEASTSSCGGCAVAVA